MGKCLLPRGWGIALHRMRLAVIYPEAFLYGMPELRRGCCVVTCETMTGETASAAIHSGCHQTVSARSGSAAQFQPELKPGVLGLLGPNGAGKTTLMSILATITRATGGHVLWNGVD